MTEAPTDDRPDEGFRPFASWAGRGPLRGWIPTLCLIAAVVGARLAYAWIAGVYLLVEDEAHYWEWSRHLEWSYYSKGPGIAWVIRAATELLGTSEAAIRTPAALACGVLALACAGMARSIFTREGAPGAREGFAAAGIALLIPVFQAVGMLMTIDGPYLACWACAGWAALSALRRGSGGAWAALGAAVALGFVFKYTIVLLVPGLALFALVQRRHLVVSPRWRSWAVGGVVLAMLGLVPVAVWNASHDWATVRHLLGHAGLPGGDQPTLDAGNSLAESFKPLGLAEYVGVQFGVVGPMLVVLVAGALARRSRVPDLEGYAGDRGLCLWCAAPILIGYGVLSLFTRIEGNWPIAAYVTLIPLAAGQVVRAKDDVRRRTAEWLAAPAAERRREGIFRRRPETLTQIAWDWAVGFGLVAGVVMLRLDLLAQVPGPQWSRDLIKMDRIVARLSEADVRAAHAARLMERLEAETGREAVLIAQQYGRASQMAFYLPGRPTTYAASGLLGGRRTQYDKWPHTDLRSAEVRRTLEGRPAVLVGAYIEQWTPWFDRVEPIGLLEGERKSGRTAYLGYGYVGPGGSAAEGTE